MSEWRSNGLIPQHQHQGHDLHATYGLQLCTLWLHAATDVSHTHAPLLSGSTSASIHAHASQSPQSMLCPPFSHAALWRVTLQHIASPAVSNSAPADVDDACVPTPRALLELLHAPCSYSTPPQGV